MACMKVNHAEVLMACMKVVNHADVFMNTTVRYHLERIKFNPALWDTMVSRYEYFWLNYMAPVQS